MEQLLEKLQEAEEIAFYESTRNEEQKEVFKMWDNSLRILIKEVYNQIKAQKAD